MNFILAGISFLLAIAVQFWVAGDPVIHVLVQFPLLAISGYLLVAGQTIRDVWVGPALVLAVCSILFWMLPRTLDAVLNDWGMHFAKFALLPLTVGVPLALCWKRLHLIVRGFVKTETISMLGILGFLYTHAPVRICNSYLIDDQIRLGFSFFYVAGALSLLWIIPVFRGAEVPTNQIIKKLRIL